MYLFCFSDLLLFKLAFHTYEALYNKYKLNERNTAKEKKEIDDKDFDIVSNLSDESTVTISGPPGPMKEKKL